MQQPPQPPQTRYRPYKPHTQPFWQADKPYLHDGQITDGRFRALGYIMSFIAGAINAGGFFAVQRYTSHITGAMSGAADAAFLGDWEGALVPLAVVIAFLLGAAHSNWTILWAKRHRFRSGYGLSMWLESFYLLVFGLLGVALSHYGKIFVPPTLLLLCFIMGMHNTVLTVLSGSVIRSTHMTGTVTDLGIELSKVLYYRRSDNPRLPDVRVNKPKMRLLLTLLAANQFLIAPVIAAHKAGTGNWLLSLAGGSFGIWHGISSLIYLACGLIGAGLLLRYLSFNR